MGKKRAKPRDTSPAEGSYAEPTDVKCKHIHKGTDNSWLRKSCLPKDWNLCQVCEQEKGSEQEPQSEKEDEQDLPVVWLCLKCGHRGCGRFSENQHAIKHYEKPRSDSHCLVLSLENWSVWCYICDDEVDYSSKGQLAQLISTIKKQTQDQTKPKTARKAKDENTEQNAAEDNTSEKERENKDMQKENRKCTNLSQPEMQTDAVPVRGLSNLGNTCFFNAVLQNLSQTWLLRELLSDFRDEEKSLLITSSSELDPLQVRLSRPGSLTLAMCQLLNEIQVTKKNVVTPQELFTQVCKKAARFKGFQQQDSQELLRYLLDGMRAEESARVTTGILEALKNSGKRSEAEQKQMTKEYKSADATKSFVEQVFGGDMTSTVMCKECKTISVVTEMFLDLSLPVTDEAYRKKKGVQTKRIESGDCGQRVNSSPVKESEDMPTGTGSKYQQKKAKKQAKKQNKNQRRQQKQGAKVTLDLLTNDNTEDTQEASPSSKDGQLESESACQPNEPVDQSEPVEQYEEDENEEEIQSSISNRFISLTEDEIKQNGEDCKEMKLSERMRALSLSSEETQHKEAEPEAEAGSRVDSEEESDMGFVLVNQDPEQAFSTLVSREPSNPSESSVESSLHQFTRVEDLTHENSLLCVTCSKRAGDGRKKVYREALKQILISSPPPVLTLHLKRFQQIKYSVCKVNRHVQFPQVLDLAPFCSINCKGLTEGQVQVLYSLYGVVEHSGTMRSGHYTAFVKSRPHSALLNGAGDNFEAAPPRGSWFHVSDSSVQPVSESKVQNSQAYLLFYEKIS